MKRILMHDCPEERVLLDYLAGELDPATARNVERHLKICADCALSADVLSEDMADIDRAIEIELRLPPLRLAAARARLQERQEAFEIGRASRGFRIASRRFRPGLALAAAISVLVVGAMAVQYLLPYLHPDEPTLTAQEALQRVQESIPTRGTQPVMLRYQVEIAQLEPVSVAREHQLVIWSDPSSGGYAARLDDPDGSLRNGVWRQGSRGPTLAYDRSAGERLETIDPARRDSEQTLVASMAVGIDCDALATGFARWLEARQWHPLEVARDFALLASGDATLRLERTEDELVISATKQEGDLRAIVSLTLGALSYEPHSLQIRFQSAKGESTFRLVQNEARYISAAHFDSSVFEAPFPSPRVSRARPAPVTRQRDPASDRLSPGIVEARLRYALHEAGACLGEPVEIVRGADGGLTVRGIVGTRDMKAAILRAIERSRVPESVSLEIQTRSEAIAASGHRAEIKPVSVPPAVQAVRQTGDRRLRRIPIATDLTAYFRSDDPLKSSDLLARELSDFARGAVERADDLLRRAWALRRLAEQYGNGSGDGLPRESKALLREMCQDHLHGIAAAARATADQSLPPLEAIAVARGIETRPPGALPPGPPLTASWPESFLAIFDAASSIHRDTVALMTVRLDVAGNSAVATGSRLSQRAAEVDHTVRRLLATSRAFELELARTTDAFVADPAPASAGPLRQEARR